MRKSAWRCTRASCRWATLSPRRSRPHPLTRSPCRERGGEECGPPWSVMKQAARSASSGARVNRWRATRDLLVPVAPIDLGEGRDVGELPAARARGSRLRPRRAAFYGAPGGCRLLSSESPVVLELRVRPGRSRAHARGPDAAARKGIGNRAIAGRLRAAGSEAARRSGRAGAGAVVRGCRAGDGGRVLHGAGGVGAWRRHIGGRPRRTGAPSWRSQQTADGQEDSRVLSRRSVAELVRRRAAAVPAEAFTVAAPIVEAVRAGGEAALRQYAERFAEVAPGGGGPLFLDRPALDRALAGLPAGDRARLERVAERIRAFAEAQKRALSDVTVTVPGGTAGHWIAPLERAGCYAPGGRYPLPSSVLMTAVTARAAGVGEIWVASPKPGALTLAAAAVAGADGVLAAGGAHAIAALAFGAGPIPPCDVVVGPGNRYVTAAKQLVAGRVAIDLLAGPSELVVFADATASPAVIAADLLAQAEHDPDAMPVLVALDPTLPDRVDAALARQLADLPTGETARAALWNGGVIVVANVEEGIAACDALAHVELLLETAAAVAPRLAHFGALFIGAGSAEVLGDYGAGPNHVLPTAGTARSKGGLSVYTFLRVRSWLRIDDVVGARPLIEDAAWFGRVEGLEGHARSAERRLD